MSCFDRTPSFAATEAGAVRALGIAEAGSAVGSPGRCGLGRLAVAGSSGCSSR